MNTNKLVDEEKDYIIEMRRHFHQNPELSWQEFATTKRLCEEMEKMGIPYKKFPKTGLIATIKGTRDHPIIGIRADIDALPVTESLDIPFKSLNPNVMHACGHDAHIAMLLGAAKVLSQNKDRLNCTVRLLFQPAEEVIQGARTLLDDPDVMGCDNFVALHVLPYMQTGTLSVEAGPRFASADFFNLKIIGKGGHGSMPHDSIDPLIAACAVVNNLQTISSKEIDPRETCVISVCSLNCGQLGNVIANEAILSGTTRAFNPAVRCLLEEKMERIIKNTCETYRTSYEFEYINGTPPPINEAASSARAENAVRKALGEKCLVSYAPSTGGEDFALLLEKIPGLLAFLGTGNAANDQCYPLHHARFDIDEDALVNGVSFFVQYVLETQD